jgi:O-antigen/teichoic acid export membrane protein
VLALAFFIGSLMTYPGYACKLTGRTDLILVSIAISAAANVALNVLLIPRYGVMGAALSCLLAGLIRLIVLAIVVTRLFPLPLPEPIMVLAAVLGSAAMSVWLWAFYGTIGWIAACYIVPGAAIIYASVYLLVANLGGLKSEAALFVRRS